MKYAAGLLAPAVTVVFITASARADVFALSNSHGGDGYVTSVSSNGFNLFGANNGVGPNYTIYSATAEGGGTVSFHWAYSTADSFPIFDPAGFYLNGTYIQLTTDNSSTSQSGNYSTTVSAGDVYGVYVYSADTNNGRGNIAVSNLTGANAPGPIPGTGLLSYLVVAFGGLFAFARKKLEPFLAVISAGIRRFPLALIERLRAKTPLLSQSVMQACV